jgi:hypothetical protein
VRAGGESTNTPSSALGFGQARRRGPHQREGRRWRSCQWRSAWKMERAEAVSNRSTRWRKGVRRGDEREASAAILLAEGVARPRILPAEVERNRAATVAWRAQTRTVAYGFGPRRARCRTAPVSFGHGSGSAGAFKARVRHATVSARRGAWHTRWRQRANEWAQCREREADRWAPVVDFILN